jgi:hypothetical protein
MECKKLSAHLETLYGITETPDGCQIETTCTFPSFERVKVYISKSGDSFRVHDNGGAFASAWDHGRNDKIIKKALSKEASRFHLKLDNDIFVAENVSEDWLPSAILAVANAASKSAYNAVDHIVAAAEADLVARIYAAIRNVVPVNQIIREYELHGNSGKMHHFNFGIGNFESRLLLIDAVSPHHSSIAHKYTAFSDVKAALGSSMIGFAVYERSLHPEDAALMGQVADLVPISVISEGAKRVFQ